MSQTPILQRQIMDIRWTIEKEISCRSVLNILTQNVKTIIPPAPEGQEVVDREKSIQTSSERLNVHHKITSRDLH
jgi:hypothetical protein